MNENKSVEARRTLEGPAWDEKAKRYKEWVKVNNYATQFLLSRIKMDSSSLVEHLEERNRTLELNTESRSKEALIWWEKSNRTERSVL